MEAKFNLSFLVGYLRSMVQEFFQRRATRHLDAEITRTFGSSEEAGLLSCSKLFLSHGSCRRFFIHQPPVLVILGQFGLVIEYLS